MIFEKDDTADHVYYLLRGEILLQDSKKLVADGQLLGLTGVFSNERRRTDSALCLTDVEYGVIPAKGSGYWCVRTPCLEISSSVPWCSASSLCTKNRNRCGLKTHSHEFREAGKPGIQEFGIHAPCSTVRARDAWIVGKARNEEVRLLLFVIPGSPRYP